MPAPMRPASRPAASECRDMFPSCSDISYLVLQSRASEIGLDRLRYGQGVRARKERVRILGADHLPEWAFRCARQLCKARDGNLAHCRLILPEPLDGVPRHREGTRVLDVNVRLQHVAVLDQAEALNHVKLLGVRCAESVHKRPII